MMLSNSLKAEQNELRARVRPPRPARPPELCRLAPGIHSARDRTTRALTQALRSGQSIRYSSARGNKAAAETPWRLLRLLFQAPRVISRCRSKAAGFRFPRHKGRLREAAQLQPKTLQTMCIDGARGKWR